MRPILTLALALLAFIFSGCDIAKKTELAGRWVSKETVVEKGFTGDRSDSVLRTLSLDSNGRGEFTINANGNIIRRDIGNWTVVADVFILDHEGGKSNYFRILRLTKERLVIRTEEGFERIYDRVQ